MSFVHLIMVAIVDPPVRDPTLVLVGWTLPAAGSPDVVVTFIAVIAVDPRILAPGRVTTFFNDDAGRGNANEDVRGQA